MGEEDPRPYRVELDCGKALLHIVRRAHDGAVGVGLGAGLTRGSGVEIGIGAQLVVHLAAEQVIDRLVERLAHDIPASHFHRAEHALGGQIGVLGIARGIDGAPQVLDAEGVRAHHEALTDVLHQAGYRAHVKGHPIGLAHALDAIGGVELEENPIAAPVIGLWVAYHKGLETSNLHPETSFFS